VLVLMVATAQQAESVLYGEGKAAAALKPGSVVLLMATVGPAAVEDWARRLAVTGVQIVDAPVSGGAARAGQGDLLIMVSGSETALATVQPLLDVMARNAPVVGTEPGEGQKVKLVNQLLCGVHIAVAAEALAYAEALGLDAGETWEVLRHGAAASFMLDDRGGPDDRQSEQRHPLRRRHFRQGHGSGHRSGSREGLPHPACLRS
jgi:3-hydroxyisobutyrate dehydrogenase/putative dehydrogenase